MEMKPLRQKEAKQTDAKEAQKSDGDEGQADDETTVLVRTITLEKDSWLDDEADADPDDTGRFDTAD